MDIGTFLLMQSPAARPSQEVYARGLEPTIDELLDRYLVIGTPERDASQIKEVQKVVGITHFNCSFRFGDLSRARVLKSMELFAKEVMPAIA